uniref:50S ribosomal protein L18 n=1 Tax=Anthurium amnicola TaxID=1678845 RepID=A0A1D1Y518_9ARAE
MAAAGSFLSPLCRRRAAGTLLLRRFSHFPFSAPSPPHTTHRLFSTESGRRAAGLLFSLPLPGCDPPVTGGFGVELVDSDLWRVSSALAHAWRPPEAAPPTSTDGVPVTEEGDEVGEGEEGDGDSPDFDEIEELRLRKKLFYKLDRGSMEFEECSLSLFRRQKSKSKKKNPLESGDPRSSPEPRKKGDAFMAESPKRAKPTKLRCQPREISPSMASGAEEDGKKQKKRERTQTFNQLTDPYHLPFCLDIYISKGSVRACVVHRATSKVVAVAHSISKDMKYDLASRRDAAACAAVGAALAQRALSDDIHNVVYTPRKGEKIEGKLQVVLQSIVDSGIDVKVKVKQRTPLKGRAASF